MRSLLAGLFLLGLLVAPANPSLAQPAEPREQSDIASYTLDARLDPSAKQILGTGQIRFRNSSAAPVSEVWMRLYLNAFRDTSTQWMIEAGPDQQRRLADGAPGWIRLERLAISGGPALTIPANAATETIVPIALPAPLAPGALLSLDVAWTSQLPQVVARTGFSEDFFMAGQWYPKLAAFHGGQWDTEPWHANAEFFHDFGDYDLSITTPPEFVVGATGLKTEERTNSDGTLTQRFVARRVTDVAWSAWPGFQQVVRKIRIPGAEIEVELLAAESERASFERYFDSAFLALDSFSRWYGLYPWGKLTIVVPPAHADGAGGMEYPMLVTVDPPVSLPFNLGAGIREVEATTIHEIAHQWFPMQVQTNEAAEAWLDEAFADYLTFRVMEGSYLPNRGFVDLPFIGISYVAVHRFAYAVLSNTDQPLATRAWDFPDLTAYSATVYSKGALSLLSLERTLGEERFTQAMRAYADRWRWSHPTTADFRASITESLGQPLDFYFEGYVRGAGTLDYQVTSLSPEAARVERLGDPTFPVSVVAQYADGRSTTLPWPTGSTTLDIQPPAGTSLVAVQVDPDRQFLLQPDRINDARSLRPDTETALAGTVRWWQLAQAFLQMFGQFG